ncbi:unnamed protein product [Pedinophyceae sp. YPF-701]|nr:unnamed protein product [Pedinophyceae sp. YPF-701]
MASQVAVGPAPACGLVRPSPRVPARPHVASFRPVAAPAAPKHALQRHAPRPCPRRVTMTAVSSGSEQTDDAVLSEYREERSPTTEAAQQCKRLQALCEIRKIFTGLLRAEMLLALPSPLLPALQQDKVQEMTEEEQEAFERERVETALADVVEMKVLSNDLKRFLKGPWKEGAPLAFEDSDKAVPRVEARTKELADLLRKRAGKEVDATPLLPPRLVSKMAKLRTTDASKVPRDELEGALAAPARGQGAMRRLEAAEREVERFVGEVVRPAIGKAAEEPKESLSSVAEYVSGVWTRLNGGGRAQTTAVHLVDLPRLRAAARESVPERRGRLALAVDHLDRRLQEASKEREAKVRRGSTAVRARMAGELKQLDRRVDILSRALAVRTLQLELDHIYSSLEDEGLDLESLWQAARRQRGPRRKFSESEEFALLVAEFVQHAEAVASMRDLLMRGEVSLVDEEVLMKMTVEVPDLRERLGIPDAAVFGGQGISVTKIKLKVEESTGKVAEGGLFLLRGVRMLGSDVGSAGKLFARAATGTSLKPREVAALRRTAQDLLVFIPFAIILIAPLTPVGHVLIFGFLQRYFPGFFPSQFTQRRQEVMIKYEELKRQLEEAQQQLIDENEKMELSAAEAALKRLVPYMASAGGAEDGLDTPASRTVRSLETMVQRAADASYGTVSDDEEDDEKERQMEARGQREKK